MAPDKHNRQIVVWDAPDTVESGGRVHVKVGVKCSAGCRPGGWKIELRDHNGQTLATAAPGDEPWQGTAALYYAEIDLEAPEREGLYAWEAVAPATGTENMATGATNDDATGRIADGATGTIEDPGTGRIGDDAAARTRDHATPSTGDGAARDALGVEAAEHGAARASFNVRVVPHPECRLTVVAIDKESRTPVEGARVVVHPYRALTDARGIAEIPLPRGAYRLFVSGGRHFPFRSDGELTADTTIRAELEPDREPSDAEIWP